MGQQVIVVFAARASGDVPQVDNPSPHPRQQGRQLEREWYESVEHDLGGDVVRTRSEVLTGGRMAYDLRVPVVFGGRNVGSYHLGLDQGTGKEVIAESIHQNSLRRDGPFVTVNMAAVTSQLVESELFGHVKGAFTGATDSRVERFESASRGTIFIDEIGDFALESQAKLLRVLENRKVTPIGSNDDRTVDVRVVAAASRDLNAMVRDGEFREDLYYRLNVVNLHLPPLRERPEDIPLLVEHFLRELAQRLDRPSLSIDGPLREFMETYDWPGNIRQLRNALESMVVLAVGDLLTVDDLPTTLHDSPHRNDNLTIPPGMSLEDVEREAVEQALAEHDGNRTHAAAALKISVRTLQRKLKAWGQD